MEFRTVLVLTTLLLSVNAKFSKIDGRIVGGNATTIEEYPYQVSVIYVDSHYCGGSIINEFHVLTAAHCTNGLDSSNLYVRAGSTIVNEGGQFKEVERYFQHEKFNKDTYDFDISVLRLKDGLSFGTGVQPISLPAQDESDVPGECVATATGWGKLSSNGPLPLELQKVDLPTIAVDYCRLFYDDAVTDRMFCAGYVKGQKDTCQGDSGGPLAYNGNLLGITSWGDGCGEANSPGVYTKVAYFRNYIDEIISN